MLYIHEVGMAFLYERAMLYIHEVGMAFLYERAMLFIHEVGMAFRIMVAKKWYLNTLLDIDPQKI